MLRISPEQVGPGTSQRTNDPLRHANDPEMMRSKNVAHPATIASYLEGHWADHCGDVEFFVVPVKRGVEVASKTLCQRPEHDFLSFPGLPRRVRANAEIFVEAACTFEHRSLERHGPLDSGDPDV